MLLVSVRVSEPGRHTRARAVYGFQPKVQSPRLSCGYGSTGGRGLTGTRTIRTTGAKRYTPKYRALYTHTRGHYTLALVAG
jgi:hypothetical protein